MKKISLSILIVLAFMACSSDKKNASSQAQHTVAHTPKDKSIDTIQPIRFLKSQIYYDGPYDKMSSFIVISKTNLTLSVYATAGNDTPLIARYPVCLSKNKGQKQKVGDMKTPESELGKPFRISQIQDASDWTHDFGDGRGSIKAYGNWFLRLETPGHRGIGIHGSTNNETTVPGRASEGCIRLLDSDIIHLKENYARVGMPVIIKTETQGNLPFENKLE